MELGLSGWKELPHPHGQSRKLKHPCSCRALKWGVMTATVLRDQPEHKGWLLPMQQHRTAVIQLCCSSVWTEQRSALPTLHYTLPCFGALVLPAFGTVNGLLLCCSVSTSAPTVKAMLCITLCKEKRSKRGKSSTKAGLAQFPYSSQQGSRLKLAHHSGALTQHSVSSSAARPITLQPHKAPSVTLHPVHQLCCPTKGLLLSSNPPGREPAALLQVMCEPSCRRQQQPKVRRGRLDGSGEEFRVVLNTHEEWMLYKEKKTGHITDKTAGLQLSVLVDDRVFPTPILAPTRAGPWHSG